ncbi:MAG: hypothetical protein ACE5G0_16595 [Rhodothermales bacterium]
MPDEPAQRSALSDPLIMWLLGFFGAFFGFLLLPRTLKFVLRKLVLETISEIVAVVITGLLTEKAVNLVTRKEDAPPLKSGNA